MNTHRSPDEDNLVSHPQVAHGMAASSPRSGDDGQLPSRHAAASVRSSYDTAILGDSPVAFGLWAVTVRASLIRPAMVILGGHTAGNA